MSLTAAVASGSLILIVYTLAMYLIPPKSKVRYCAVAAMAGLEYLYCTHVNRYMVNGSLAAVWTTVGILSGWSACEVLVCSQVGSGDAHRSPLIRKDAKDGKPNQTAPNTLSWVIGLPFNFRRIGTRWQVKNIPAFPNGVPSVSAFIRRKICTIVVVYLLCDALTSAASPKDLIDAHHENLFSRLSEVTKDELIFRVSAVIGFYFVTGLYNILMNDVAVLILAVAKMTTPDLCPPLHNSFRDAWSLRQFWGVSWHQGLRKTITGLGDLVADSVFARGTRISRYSRLVMAFTMSGLLHLAGDMAMGIPVQESGALPFFIFQSFGIIFEDAVRAVYKMSGFKLPGVVENMVGYLWVGSFHFWSTPMWMFPPARHTNPQRDSLIPFRVVGKIAKAFA